jgi:hypothetical protein
MSERREIRRMLRKLIGVLQRRRKHQAMRHALRELLSKLY